MRKRIFGRRFKRDTNTRKALFRGLMRSVILHGRIETTEAKAKAIKGTLEKLVTKAKVRGDAAISDLMRNFDREVASRLISQVAPKFSDRKGGYLRIIKLGNRKKDNAPIVILEWVEEILRVSDVTSLKEEKVKKEEKVTKVESEAIVDTKEKKNKKETQEKVPVVKSEKTKKATSTKSKTKK